MPRPGESRRRYDTLAQFPTRCDASATAELVPPASRRGVGIAIRQSGNHPRLDLGRRRMQSAAAQQTHRGAHLHKILPAGCAKQQVQQNGKAFSQRQRMLQVVGNQLTHVTAFRDFHLTCIAPVYVGLRRTTGVTRQSASVDGKGQRAMPKGGTRRSEFDDPDFLAGLRREDGAAYRQLIRRYHTSLVGVAASIIGSHAQAEEVVQDAWLAVHANIGGFEGRSSLTTWLFSIVLNRARTRAMRESRLVALPELDGGDPDERAVPLSAFQPDGHWIEAPRLWDDVSPERIVAGRQLWDHVQAAIERLPAGQRAVLILRDMEDCAADEACALLGITAENQRVLLHRARGRVRAAVDQLVGEAPAQAARARAPVRQRPPSSPLGRWMAAALRACGIGWGESLWTAPVAG